MQWCVFLNFRLSFQTTTLYAPYLIHISFVNITYVNDKHFYGCQASNILGNDTRYIEVALKDSPVFIFDNGEGNYNYE